MGLLVQNYYSYSLLFAYFYSVIRAMLLLLHIFIVVSSLINLQLIVPAAARLAVVVVSTLVEPGSEACSAGVPLPERGVGFRYAVPAHAVFCNRVGNALGVEKVCLVVEVVDCVALLVVAHIESDASLTTEQTCFLLGLEDFSAGEETAGGNAVLEEGGIVGAESKQGGHVWLAVGLVELLKVLLDCVGTSRSGEVERTAISILNTQDVVR